MKGHWLRLVTNILITSVPIAGEYSCKFQPNDMFPATQLVYDNNLPRKENGSKVYRACLCLQEVVLSTILVCRGSHAKPRQLPPSLGYKCAISINGANLKLSDLEGQYITLDEVCLILLKNELTSPFKGKELKLRT